MSIYNVIIDKEQINVLKRSCIKNLLDNTRKNGRHPTYTFEV